VLVNEAAAFLGPLLSAQLEAIAPVIRPLFDRPGA
jgi:hypothetical protein